MTTLRGTGPSGAFGLALAAALVALPGAAAGQASRHDESPVTPRMMALGGRAEALGSSTSSMFGNPAMLGAARTYHLDAYALYDPTTNRIALGSAAVDSTRGTVAAGLSYVFGSVDGPGGHRRSHDTRLNIALPLSDAFGIAATARFLDVSAGPPAGNAMSTLQPRAWTGFTFDAGLFVRPVQALHLTVSGHNLNNPDTTAAPLSVGLGAALMPINTLAIVADALIDLRTMDAPRGRYSGGVELFVGNHVPLRAGYLYDDVRGGAQAVTAGIGYLDESFGIELAMRQGIVPEPQTTMMLSLRYFYRPQP